MASPSSTVDPPWCSAGPTYLVRVRVRVRVRARVRVRVRAGPTYRKRGMFDGGLAATAATWGQG